jgi:hypothetical protein
MDTQSVEILGRNRLINELVEGGIEVAQPLRDRGVDVIAYLDLNSETKKFTAVPIQMKASSEASFSVHRKYSRISNLIIAFVWGVRDPRRSQVFALTYREAEGVARAMGWTKTASWRRGGYSTTRPGDRLLKLIRPYEMTPRDWRKKLAKALR